MRGRLVVAAATVLAAVAAPAPASAGWQVAGAGEVQTAAGSLPSAPVPTVTETTVLGVRTVTLSWPTPADGVPLSGWRVTRTGGSGLLSGTCAGVTSVLGLTGVLGVTGTPATVSCQDLPGLTGAVRYAVTPVSGAWVGTASALSASAG